MAPGRFSIAFSGAIFSSRLHVGIHLTMGTSSKKLAQRLNLALGYGGEIFFLSSFSTIRDYIFSIRWSPSSRLPADVLRHDSPLKSFVAIADRCHSSRMRAEVLLRESSWCPLSHQRWCPSSRCFLLYNSTENGVNLLCIPMEIGRGNATPMANKEHPPLSTHSYHPQIVHWVHTCFVEEFITR